MKMDKISATGQKKIELLPDLLPQQFKFLRETLGLSQNQFAKHVNRTKQTIYLIETSTYYVPLKYIDALRQAVSPELWETALKKLYKFYPRLVNPNI